VGVAGSSSHNVNLSSNLFAYKSPENAGGGDDVCCSWSNGSAYFQPPDLAYWSSTTTGGNGEPSPGADVDRVSLVPAQMWAGASLVP
jgi:hypothetical protein